MIISTLHATSVQVPGARHSIQIQPATNDDAMLHKQRFEWLYAAAHDQSDPLVDKDYRNQVEVTDKDAGAFERLIRHPFLEQCSTKLKSKGLTPIDESE